MIESLRLTNWQKHSGVQIDFDQITVLVGSNDSGKSSLLRGLLFIMLNEWGGAANSHVKFGMGFSTLELTIDSACIIRTKGDGENSYQLNEECFHAFGFTVPLPIAQLLNVSIDNFQQQDDPPFWLTLTGGQAASALNDIFCLSTIDDSLSNIASELRRAKTEKKIIEERLETAKAKSKSLLWVKQADRDLKELEELYERTETIKYAFNRITCLVQSIQRLECSIETESRLLVAKQETARQASRILAIQEQQSRLKEIISLEEKIEQWSKTLLSKQTKLDEFMKGRCPLCRRG